MIALPLLALLVAFLIVYLATPTVPPGVRDYVAISFLAGLDAVCGGIRASLEHHFDDVVFTTGFFVNVLLAAGLAYLGDQLGVDLYLAVAIALGIRVFTNLGWIRRLVVERMRHHEAQAEGGDQGPGTRDSGLGAESGG